MSQDYLVVGNVEDLKCSKEDADALRELWNAKSEEADYSDGFDMQMMGEHLYIFADEFGDIESVPVEVRNKIGEIVSKGGLEYLTFAFASYNSRNLQGTQGGGTFRLYKDGTIRYPQIKYE